MGKMGIVMGFQALITTALGGVLMLFYYLICDRALIGDAVKDVEEKFSTALTAAKSGVATHISCDLTLKAAAQRECSISKTSAKCTAALAALTNAKKNSGDAAAYVKACGLSYTF